MTAKGRRAHAWLAPEVVQTSAMDCGPAALKCLLDGFGLPASYGRLREACQTDVDGTSIDTLEDLANAVGLVAEQVLLPVDHVLASATDVLPAIAVVRHPGGLLHFVVAWRRHGPVVQIMDPATGRRWLRTRAFADELFAHTMPVPAAAWRAWTASEMFRDALRARGAGIGIPGDVIDASVREGADAGSWQSMAALDATLRMVTAVHHSGGFGRGDAGRTLKRIWDQARSAATPTDIVPADYWTARAAPPSDRGDEHVMVRGAVLVRIRGVRDAAEREQREAALPREVAAAMREPSPKPGRHLLNLLAADGILAPATLTIALCFAATGVVLEALLFRSLIDLGAHLPLSGQRVAAMAAIVGLSGLLLALELPIASVALGLGRRLETRLRIAFLHKIPRLADRYFQSRPSSDMAERAHAAHQIRELPQMGTQLVRSVFELLLTAAGIALLFPRSAPFAIAAALAALAIPAIAHPWLRERDLRQRTHTGALTRFFLDAFLGVVPVRAHAGERALAREQEGLLVEWGQAGTALLRTAVATSAAQLVVGFGLAAWLLFSRGGLGDEGGGALLLAYWALNMPIIGQRIAQLAWQYPTQRNLTLRLLEPLGAIEDTQDAASPSGMPLPAPVAGVSVRLDAVTVRAGGHTILEDATLAIAPSAHVAIVGASGAGKSTLVGLLLGWHRPASGEVLVEGERLEGARLDRLRGETAWIDPAVQLWNRSLADNLDYGRTAASGLPVGARVADADLRSLIAQLPDGLQTPLGEGGALLSGGEGQRVRFGRALGRTSARLAILDEPFRGLERERRATLLRRARDRWRNATLVCVTHDIGETSGFDRVVVIADGRIVEDGVPSVLAACPDSRYRAMLDAETGLHQRLWADPAWRRIRLADGKLAPDPSSA